METEAKEPKSSMQGAFMESLKRNNRKIRDDRAEAIHEDAELFYRRSIEDIRHKVKKLEREKENLIDLSPTSADSLVLASDFDSQAFVKKDIDLSVSIRNENIRLEAAEKSYRKLFGDY